MNKNEIPNHDSSTKCRMDQDIHQTQIAVTKASKLSAKIAWVGGNKML